MIQHLKIKSFKSIKDLQLDCKRVNLFIGEPNTGKSNILEALALFAFAYNPDLKSLVRLSDLSNLFYENDLSNSIGIEIVPEYVEMVRQELKPIELYLLEPTVKYGKNKPERRIAIR